MPALGSIFSPRTTARLEITAGYFELATIPTRFSSTVPVSCISLGLPCP